MKYQKGMTVNKLNETNKYINIRSMSKHSEEVINLVKSKDLCSNKNEINLNFHTSKTFKPSNKNVLFKTTLENNSEKKSSPKKMQSVVFDQSTKFFCPYCDHCNDIKDKNLDNHIQNLNKANVIINKGFDYLVRNLKSYDKTVFDLFSFTDNNIEDIIKDEKPYNNDKLQSEIKENIFEV